jgi:hypothetical protein
MNSGESIEMPKTWKLVKSALLIAVGAFVVVNSNAAQAQTDFASTVSGKHPLAYYRLDATNGKSVVGTSTYSSTGGVTVHTPGAPVGDAAKSKAVSFDGKTGKIVTTQKGGIQTAATLMAWVNLAELPSKTGRTVYVMGESQVGNDLDLQFLTDDTVKFYTAAGGNVSYNPQKTTLVNQWHMIVATLDTTSKKRILYWDGKQVAADEGGGTPNKVTALSIGESLVFTGRFFPGEISEVALWNRALSAKDVEEIYASRTNVKK